MPIRRIIIARRARHDGETAGMRGRVERQQSRLVALATLGGSGGVHARSRQGVVVHVIVAGGIVDLEVAGRR